LVKLRLKRIGRKKLPFYRIVAMDVNSPRDGQALGQLGTYDPLKSRIDLDEEGVVRWLKLGAQMTPTVRDLLRSQGILARLQGLEGKVREDALLRQKPKSHKKLAAAAPADDASASAPAEGPKAVAVAQESPAADETKAPEAAPEAAEPGDASKD